jgi:hypothetical protein
VAREVTSLVFGRRGFRSPAKVEIRRVGGLDQAEVVGIDEAETITQIDDGAKHRRFGHAAARFTGFLPSPPAGAVAAVLPEILAFSKPIVIVAAGAEFGATRDKVVDDFLIAAVVAEDQRLPRRQRKAGFSLPSAV